MKECNYVMLLYSACNCTLELPMGSEYGGSWGLKPDLFGMQKFRLLGKV